MPRRSKSQRDEYDVQPRPKRKLPQKLTPTRLRIVAGSMGGRRIEYNGDPATRPMKEKTREAVFSLLGGYLYNTLALDLFGGTGILGIEAVSRGAERATILELSRMSVSTIVQNLKLLRADDKIDVHNVDTLRWLRSLEMNTRDWPDLPWVVFCCPPYRLWQTDGERLAEGLRALYAAGPSGTRFVCETDQHYRLEENMPEWDWDIRHYQPAYVGVCEKE